MARSGLPLPPRCPVLTLVSVDVDEEADAARAACDARLAVIPGCIAFIFDCLRCWDILLGELAAESGCLAAMPYLKLVAGGCGRGLTPAGVLIELTRLTGELTPFATCPFRPLLILTPVMNSCIDASWGVSLRAGSHLKHLAMKSRKASSSHFRAWRRSFELGLRRLPFDETVRRGLPMESKNSFLRPLFSMRCFSGGPKTSIIHASCSCSFSPGNMGYPV